MLLQVKDLDGSAPNKKARQISVGQDHSCALMVNGKVYCWGYGYGGVLGNGGNDDSSVPVLATEFEDLSEEIHSIAAGFRNIMVILKNTTVYCTGWYCDHDRGETMTLNLVLVDTLL